jgi:NAD(P)-dependent dehydrogenase (short-subunit alcohol dehydrogenase family)
MDMFEGKAIIVTGGASGIGRALCGELAARGAMVTVADIDEALLEETVDSLRAKGRKAVGAVLDVTDYEAVAKLVDDTACEHGCLDYMFNNAGICIFGEAHDLSIDDWRRVIDVNLYGVVNGVAAAYPVMVKQGFGHVVNTASLAGLVPASGEISYTASKYGIVGLTNALRAEGAAYGVKASVVCPGFIRTPIYENLELVKLDREKLMKITPRGASVEKCASTIVRGVEKNKAIILVTAQAGVMWLLQRISPGLVRRLSSGLLIKSIRTSKIE